MKVRLTLALLACLLTAAPLRAQLVSAESLPLPADTTDIAARLSLSLDSARIHHTFKPHDLRPAVFDYYSLDAPLAFQPEMPESPSYFNWLNDELFLSSLLRQTRQRYMIAHPDEVRYNESLLPEAPKRYRLQIDPSTARLAFVGIDSMRLAPSRDDMSTIEMPEIKKKHWLHKFEAGVQFSQAYLSPNWYQGGSNNLALLLNVAYSVKLNRNYHPNMLAEMDVAYKFHAFGTPEDSLRNYNIAEDLFQFNGKFGWKAWRKWFYSVSAQFKTQFFNNYEVNDPALKSAFLSPSELNLGFGVTYEYKSPGESLAMTLSLAPFSYNLKTCVDRRLNPADFGIDTGHRFKSEYGSGLTFNMTWQMFSNIAYTTRLFVFSNYENAQGDWENTFSFAINRFLSTQLLVHLRYDSTTPRPDKPSRWHKWQLKEILSFGLAYRFSTL